MVSQERDSEVLKRPFEKLEEREEGLAFPLHKRDD